MNDYVIALLLGVIEGVTEFLPVSSTAHLRVAQALFNLKLDDPYWKMFAIVIQLGAVLCLPVYFRRRIVQFVCTFPKGPNGDANIVTNPVSLVMLAAVITLGIGFCLKKVVSQNLESLNVMGWALVIGGVVMWVVDVLFRRPRTMDMKDTNLAQAAWIGVVQVLAAVFPGTSRSMATIAAGQMAGLSRAAALEFSFFVSIPVMFVATSYDLLKAVRPDHDEVGLAPGAMDAHHWLTLAIGFVVSFLVAWAVVAWFMHWVRKHGFVPFAVYRIVAGAAVLIWAMAR